MILPPKIRSGDIVRVEWRMSFSFPYREKDIVHQVMYGEDTWSHNEKRHFAFDMCKGETADHVTELYRFERTENGGQYRLIWHRPPTNIASEYRCMKADMPYREDGEDE